MALNNLLDSGVTLEAVQALDGSRRDGLSKGYSGRTIWEGWGTHTSPPALAPLASPTTLSDPTPAAQSLGPGARDGWVSLPFTFPAPGNTQTGLGNQLGTKQAPA